MAHIGSGAFSGDLEGSPLAPRIRGNASRLQVADSIFMPRFRGDYMAPNPSAATFERRAYWTSGDNATAMTASTNWIITPEMPFSGTIRSASVLGLGGPGTASLGIRKVGGVTGLPSVPGNSIVNGNPIVLSGVHGLDIPYATLVANGWTLKFVKGDVFIFILNSVATFTDLSVRILMG